MAIPMVVWTATAVGAAAAPGAVSADPRSDWYRRLDKPGWQPPRQAFGAVWTPLYALIAIAGARVLQRTSGAKRRRFAQAYAANLALNAAWTPLFFRAKSPRAALVDIVALNVSNFDLVRRARRADPLGAAFLAPYAAWTLFATALNSEIVRRNQGTTRRGRRSGMPAWMAGRRTRRARRPVGRFS